MAENAPNVPVVLVADDDAAVRWLLQTYLGQQGFEVKTVASADDALALVQAGADGIRAALLDVNVPGMSGPELLRSLRSLTPTLPALFMARASGAADPEQLRREFGAELIAKPFLDLPDVAARLRRLIAG